MTKFHHSLYGWAVEVLLILGGCTCPPGKDVMTLQPDIVAIHTNSVIIVDGVLSEDVWRYAPVVKLCAMPGARPLDEYGQAQFAWDENYLYMAVKFMDTDVVATGDANNLPHFELGDLAEVFIGSATDTWYYEFYVTPQSRHTSYFFPGPGRRFSSCMLPVSSLTVAGHTQGTLNMWRDSDVEWTAEMAIPWSALRDADPAAGPQYSWRVLVARYNYSRYLPAVELSSYPALKTVNFHVPSDYAALRLKP